MPSAYRNSRTTWEFTLSIYAGMGGAVSAGKWNDPRRTWAVNVLPFPFHISVYVVYGYSSVAKLR